MSLMIRIWLAVTLWYILTEKFIDAMVMGLLYGHFKKVVLQHLFLNKFDCNSCFLLFFVVSLGVLLSMLRKELKIQYFGLHLEGNNLTQATSLLRNLSGIHTCFSFPLRKVGF